MPTKYGMAHPNPNKTPRHNPKGKSTYGPAMQACTPFQRRYVEGCYDHPDLSPIQLLPLLGYKGNNAAAKKMGQRLSRNQLVQAAMLELGTTVYRTKLPKVVSAIDAIIANPDARDHAKVLHGLLDRVGMHAVKENHTTVTHTFDRDSVIARIAAVLERNHTLLPTAPKLIEAQIISEPDSSDASEPK